VTRSPASYAALPRGAAARAVLLGGLALGFALLVAWAFFPISTLLDYIPDDSYYYFQPAAMMAEGYVPSFDGVNAGNGFNPLWMLLLWPLFKLKAMDVNLPVHLALALAGAFFILTGYMIYRLLRLFEVDEWFSVYAAVTFPLWPSAVTTAVDGEVTPVNIFVLSVLIYYYAKLMKAGGTPSRRAFIGLGLLSGLAILGRLENVGLLALLAAHYVTRRRPENKVRAGAWTAAGAAVLVVPWLAWSYSFSGSVVPTSGWAVPLMTRASVYPDAPGPWGGLVTTAERLVRDTGFLTFYSPGKCAVFAIYPAVLILGRRRLPREAAMDVLALLLTFVISLYVLNSGVRRYLRLWHLGTAFFVNQLFLWTCLALLVRGAWRRWLPHAAAVASVAFFVVDGWWTAGHPLYAHQRVMYAGAAWARAHPGVKVGAFNAGILAYYGGGNIVDLDGNMNNAAYEAVKARRVYDYAKKEGVVYIIDFERSAVDYYAPFWPPPVADKLEVYSRALDIAPYARAGKHYYIYRLR
jgi:hypothetical protein